MESRDRAALNDLLRLLDAPLGEGVRLRWSAPAALASSTGK